MQGTSKTTNSLCKGLTKQHHKKMHHGGHVAPSDHDCKAEDLSLELFRCSAANQWGETRRQDTEGQASEIDDENMAMSSMVNAETLRPFGECPFLNIFHSSCSSHLFTLVCIACCYCICCSWGNWHVVSICKESWMIFGQCASLNTKSTCKEHSSVHDGYLVHKKDKLTTKIDIQTINMIDR